MTLFTVSGINHRVVSQFAVWSSLAIPAFDPRIFAGCQTLFHLHIGNVVRLRSGGPNMTVDRAEDAVPCVWMDHTGEARRSGTLDKIKA
jgi:uncharacterized protein YodC (DUF2158 family)